MGFFDVSEGRTAEDLFTLLTTVFQKFNVAGKLVGQTYDGASVMSGDLNGLQTKIRSVAPQALFTHCYAHKLNQVLQDAASKIREGIIFFATLSRISTFFSKSTKRTSVVENICRKKIPTSSNTRWNFKGRITNTILGNREELLQTFENILARDDFAGDNEALRESVGFKRILANFNFLFLLKTFNLIFDQTNIVYNTIIQAK